MLLRPCFGRHTPIIHLWSGPLQPLYKTSREAGRKAEISPIPLSGRYCSPTCWAACPPGWGEQWALDPGRIRNLILQFTCVALS